MKKLILAVALAVTCGAANAALPANPWLISEWLDRIFPNPTIMNSIRPVSLPTNPWVIEDWWKRINPWMIS